MSEDNNRKILTVIAGCAVASSAVFTGLAIATSQNTPGEKWALGALAAIVFGIFAVLGAVSP
jgi:uncharacterized membrane protein